MIDFLSHIIDLKEKIYVFPRISSNTPFVYQNYITGQNANFFVMFWHKSPKSQIVQPFQQKNCEKIMLKNQDATKIFILLKWRIIKKYVKVFLLEKKWWNSNKTHTPGQYWNPEQLKNAVFRLIFLFIILFPIFIMQQCNTAHLNLKIHNFVN